MSQVHNTTKKTNCQHLNEAERKIIEWQLSLGTPKKQIVRLLGRNISTIRREIKHGSVIQRKTKPYISKHADDPGSKVIGNRVNPKTIIFKKIKKETNYNEHIDKLGNLVYNGNVRGSVTSRKDFI